jgi:hypothetical protein
MILREGEGMGMDFLGENSIQPVSRVQHPHFSVVSQFCWLKLCALPNKIIKTTASLPT